MNPGSNWKIPYFGTLSWLQQVSQSKFKANRSRGSWIVVNPSNQADKQILSCLYIYIYRISWTYCKRNHITLERNFSNSKLTTVLHVVIISCIGLLTFSFFFLKRSFRYENDDENRKTKRSFLKTTVFFLKSSFFKHCRFKKAPRFVNDR